MSKDEMHHVVRTLGVVAFLLMAGGSLLIFAKRQSDQFVQNQERLAEEKTRLISEQTEWLEDLRVVRESWGAMNNGPTAQIMVRPDTLLIHYMTDAGERITGRAMTEMRGRPITDIIPAGLVEPMVEAAKENPGEAIEFEGGSAKYQARYGQASVALAFRVRWNVDDFLVFEITEVGDRIQIPVPEGFE